jgi:5-methylcytosine-specific restriction endonuclease McrA
MTTDLTRYCETCGNLFTPRRYQVSVGHGRFCSHRCAGGGLNKPETRKKAHDRRAEMLRSGEISFAKGEVHPKWKGGRKGYARRRTDSGEAAAVLRAYRKANPERVREWRQNRRAGVKGQKLPRGTVARILKAQKQRCAACRGKLPKNYHLDHIVPLSKGGQHVPANVQLLCPPCNTSKQARDMIDFMQSRGLLL